MVNFFIPLERGGQKAGGGGTVRGVSATGAGLGGLTSPGVGRTGESVLGTIQPCTHQILSTHNTYTVGPGERERERERVRERERERGRKRGRERERERG